MSTTALTTSNGNQFSLYADKDSFEFACRMAKPLAESAMVPQQFQGSIPNCLIALEYAQRLEMSPLMVMQSLYIVHGRPAFSAAFIIGMVNKSRRFDKPLLFATEGQGDKRTCYAYTTKDGKEVRGPVVSIEMAKTEGWYSKKDKNDRETSKWQSMPELMLQYRAGAFFGRLYCSDLLMGLYSEDEVRDMPPEAIDVTPGVITPEELGGIEMSLPEDVPVATPAPVPDADAKKDPYLEGLQDDQGALPWES